MKEMNNLQIEILRDDWAEDVKKTINDFLHMYNKKQTKENNYVVFDLDDSTSIFDIEEQVSIYQLTHMTFAFNPNELKTILKTDLKDLDKKVMQDGVFISPYNDWIDDICSAYEHLYNIYGPFTAKGVNEHIFNKLNQDDYWLEFATKMRALYYLVNSHKDEDEPFQWLNYWHTGMTEDEIYNLAWKSNEYYSKLESSKCKWTSPQNIKSKVGVVEANWISGISVSENIKELYKNLSEVGIDVWICSASNLYVVKAAADYFGLSKYITGIIGMTIKTKNGKIVNEYDYDGKVFLKNSNGMLERCSNPIKVQPRGEGKVEAITNICFDIYGKGPIAGFMDSSGDFNFCTEFKTLKLVVCFNKVWGKINSGGTLVANVAIYERDILHYNLKIANENNDTFYVLQGRDENHMRSFRHSNKTIKLGEIEETSHVNGYNENMRNYFTNNKMHVRDIFNKFAIITPSNNQNNVLGIEYGFIKHYDGYHTHE